MNKEKYLEDYPMPVSIKKTEKILEQLKNSICKIYLVGGGSGSGFFCKIPINENTSIEALITNYHVIDDEYIKKNEEINISLNDFHKIESIKIKDNRRIYTKKLYDITIVELRKKDNLNIEFLEIDKDILQKKSNVLFQKTSIYNLSYPEGNEPKVSYEILKEINDGYHIKHFCSITNGSSGSPILYLESQKVIGIHKAGAIKPDDQYNFGTFL